jgi:hypothetical protein
MYSIKYIVLQLVRVELLLMMRAANAFNPLLFAYP